MNIKFQSIVPKTLLLAVSVSFLSFSSYAQEDVANTSFVKKPFSEGLIFSGAIGYSGYFGDLTEDVGKNILPFDNQTQLGFGLGVHKELFGFFELGVKSVIGKVKEVNSSKKPSTSNVYSFNSNVLQVGLNGNINVVNLFKRNADNKFAFLISGGYGITSYDPENSILFPGGESITFPANIDPNPLERSTTATYNYGIGARYKFNKNWAVGLEASIYNVLDDNLDSWSVASSANDSYSFLGASINYIIGKKKVGNADIVKDKEEIINEAVKLPVEDIEEEIVEEVKEKVAEDVVTKEKDVVVEEKAPIKVKTTTPALTVADFQNDIIYFDLNQNVESAALNKQISSIAAKLKKFPNAKVVLAGYADKSGPASYNQALTEKRANWVKTILVSQFNIAASRISTVGKGTAGATKSIEPKSRRVEVIKIN